MGQLRHKDTLPLHASSDDVDYWIGDLIYSSKGSGSTTYSTKADKVLEEPEAYRDLYEKAYQLRRSELHFIIARLPLFIQVKGFFLGGTSEGAMTIARFDDQRYEAMICGRFINSFSIEYCYFTPTPAAGELGGQLDVPTLNIIGTKDQYFGPEDSVAKIVAEDEDSGYGNKDLTGNGYNTMVRQGVDVGLVCVLENGVHSPCNTHDNFLRQLFDHFFTRPGSIWDLDSIWLTDPSMHELIQVKQSHIMPHSNVQQIFVPKMPFPNKWPLRKVEALRQMSSYRDAVEAQMAVEAKEEQEKQAEAKAMLDHLRQSTKKKGGHGFSQKVTVKKNYYENDKRIRCNKHQKG